jgi:hypothetical protein
VRGQGGLLHPMSCYLRALSPGSSVRSRVVLEFGLSFQNMEGPGGLGQML